MKQGERSFVFLMQIGLFVAVGLMILYSTSAYNGKVRFDDSFYFVRKQAMSFLLGIVVMFFMMHISVETFFRYSGLLYVAAIVLCILVFFCGSSVNGSSRWLNIGGLSFQPSELAKVAIILFFPTRICRQKKDYKEDWKFLLQILWAMPLIISVAVTNLSTAVILMGISAGLLFISHPRYQMFLVLALTGVAGCAAFIGFASYRAKRILAWLHPTEYENGYQTVQGLYAIGSGGWLGKGYGKGIQKLGFLPEAQNDMIFAVVCEEFGLLGAIVIILMFAGLLFQLYRFAMHTRRLYHSLVICGVMIHIAIQVILNIAVVSNSIPNTGVTLPFISYGGTSALFLMSEFGIVLRMISEVR